MASAAAKRDQIRELIKDIDIAMFTTIGEDGFPVSRPLSTQEAEFDGRVLWFFVRRNTPKVREIGRYPRVNVAYASKDRNVYLSVAGSARLVDDQAMIDALWSDALKAYFKKGRTDPNLALVEVTVHSVQYWEGPSTGIGRVIAFVAARLGADESVMGENRLLRLEEAPPRQRRAARRKAVLDGKKRATGKSAARKLPAKKPAAKKAAARKPAAKKAPAKKSPGKKAAATKSTARKPAPRRTAKKAAPRRTAR